MPERIVVRDIAKKISLSPEFSWTLLEKVSFTINQGELAALTGLSASGKSTLLAIILGYDREAGGTVVIDNVNIGQLTENRLAEFRNQNIGIAINNRTPVNFEETYKENVVNRLKKLKHNYLGEETARILRIFELESMADEKVSADNENTYYRLLLAIAFCGSPPIIIVDEVLDYFTPEESQKLLDTIAALRNIQQLTIFISTARTDILLRVEKAFCIKDKTVYNFDLNKLRKMIE